MDEFAETISHEAAMALDGRQGGDDLFWRRNAVVHRCGATRTIQAVLDEFRECRPTRDGVPLSSFAVLDTDPITIRRVPYDTRDSHDRVIAAGLGRSIAERLLVGR